ncbi:MAG: hypothetical protein C0410_00710 [Anaerolinea sp.]|nr:hypothetical protein [Anaerolinea sp.]
MSGKILRRCTICKKFHASYLVEIPDYGKSYLCYNCWKATQTSKVDSLPGKNNKQKQAGGNPPTNKP